MLTKNRLHFLPIALLVLALVSSAALAGERWLHVRVEEQGNRGENVNVNVPLSMVEALLPMIQTEEFNGGRIRLHDADLEGIDLRAALEALQDAPDADFVTVQSDGETVRVAKERNFLIVRVDGDRGRERVRVRMPLDVVDAMLGGRRDEIDILAGLQRLSQFDGDIVTVESDGTSVRVWIDDSDTGI